MMLPRWREHGDLPLDLERREARPRRAPRRRASRSARTAEAVCVHVDGSNDAPTRPRRSFGSAPTPSPVPGQRPCRRTSPSPPSASRAEAGIRSSDCSNGSQTAVRIGRHGRGTGCGEEGGRQGRRGSAARRANVASLSDRVPVAATPAAASRRTRPSPRRPRRSGRVVGQRPHRSKAASRRSPSVARRAASASSPPPLRARRGRSPRTGGRRPRRRRR